MLRRFRVFLLIALPFFRLCAQEFGEITGPVIDAGAEKPGFKVTTQSGVDVHVDNVARIDFQLQLGEMSQQVEVTGGAPLLNTESVALGSVIEAAQIVSLPLNGRDYLSLVTLSSNAVGEMAA